MLLLKKCLYRGSFSATGHVSRIVGPVCRLVSPAARLGDFVNLLRVLPALNKDVVFLNAFEEFVNILQCASCP
jgi:hypothetical protein